jgi:RHS repeat-associated protein
LHGPDIDEVLAQDNAAGSVQWMLTDHLGSVRDLVDNTGVLVKHIVYDSYGNVVAQTGPAIDSRYLFTGREFDDEVNMAYYRARYYDAGVGRFISEDPLRSAGGDTNIARYVGNAPVSYVDPYGLKAQYGGGKLPTGWRKDAHLPSNQRPWDAVGGRPRPAYPQPTREKISPDDLLSLFNRTVDKIKNFLDKCEKAREIWELTHKKDKGPKDAPVFWKKVWEMFPASDTLLGGLVTDALDRLKHGVDRYDEMLDRRLKEANDISED